MRYVEFTDENNESLGRIYLDEEQKKLKYSEDLNESLIADLKRFGIIEVLNKTSRQLFPDGPDPLLFLQNLKYEFTGSVLRASDIKENGTP